jgi:hypothetical protein
MDKNLKPFVNELYPDGHRFQQDNDPKHTSKLARSFYRENNINWIEWPAHIYPLSINAKLM